MNDNENKTNAPIKLPDLLTLAEQLPANLRSDWEGSNHYELQDPNPDGDWFWAMLADGLPPSENNCESDYGKRIGLIMDCVAMLSKPEIQAALNEADALRAEAWCDGYNTRELEAVQSKIAAIKPNAAAGEEGTE